MARYRILESRAGMFYPQRKVKTPIAGWFTVHYKKKWQYLYYDGSIAWRDSYQLYKPARFKTLSDAKSWINKMQSGIKKIHAV